ncbi:TIGR03016 family PEP-CTERM system-associated outer membrane protein [Thalassotalea sp. 1_MG-2023]|uniref:TIGR03016 family PEP-CTERM system-associated outer membrane protein n=1 Tax=Thalassotalea sp. 1_MG-2023 TaxID=3062680 RepID=UPI0026E44DDD|nr:TIGR03016 family PEP-CTERM system-associated outer membrane protein [Thalassotalea sp. 1_MG-2023]MDO6425477.1 TIGR03016 family PEP-CTERM system-associated outer membrane protein [Thalassotalea sp. 1_MG-2023]
MAIMATDTVKKNKLAVAITLCLAALPSVAGDWQFTPTLSLDETYSDNVELNQTNEISSLVSQAAVSLNSTYKTRLLNFDFQSTSTNVWYSHDHDLDDDFHSLSSNVNLRLGASGFSVFGSASIKNQAQNGARNSLADIVSGDVVQVERYSAGINYDVNNSDFSLSSSLAANTSETEDRIGERDGFSGNIITSNGSSARHIFWNANGSYQEQENNDLTSRIYQTEIKIGYITGWKFNPFIRYYDEDNKGSLNQGRTNESNSIGAGFRWEATPRLNIDLSYNTPIGDDLDIDGNEQEEYVDANINWQPSIRTQLSANYSQRFYGDSYGLNLTHSNRRLTNTISYQEQLQSFTRDNYNLINLGFFWCPEGDNTEIANCYLPGSGDISFDDYQLVNVSDYELIEDNVFSLNKGGSWQSTLALPRTTFNFSLRANERENLETSDIDEMLSTSFEVSRKIGGRSTVKFVASYTERKFQVNTDNEREDRYRTITLGYNKSLNKTLNLSVDLRHLNRSSTSQFNYEEGRVTLKITKDF